MTNTEVCDPVETNLDPKVKAALNEMANKVRGRARERAEFLRKDLSMLISDFLKDYHWARQTEDWQGHIKKLCDTLGNQVAEIDVARCVQNLSAKILEIDPSG